MHRGNALRKNITISPETERRKIKGTADAFINGSADVDAAAVAASIANKSLNPVEVALPLLPFSEEEPFFDVDASWPKIALICLD